MGAELQQILLQVSELQHWRKVFTNTKSPQRLVDVGKKEDQDEDPPPYKPIPPVCSIPRRLVISPTLGGTPVTPQLTESFRRILFGGTFHVFNYEWRKSVFQFRQLNSELSFALEMDTGGAQAVQMVIQARVIKHLLFSRQSSSDGRTLTSLITGQRDQERALAAALSESLWLAGQEVSTTVTLVTEDYCITPHLDYKLDNFTERLQLFTFKEKEDVSKFILEHIQSFTEERSHGVILFLYSLICSRTVDRLQEDLNSTTSHLLHLRLGDFVCRQALLNLLLTGRASPHVFNGTLYIGEDGLPLDRPLQGVLTRSDVGYLHWSREQMERGRLPQVGSMLKTPRFPVWLCSVDNSLSVMFSLNLSLVSDWRTERRFHLFLCSGMSAQQTAARLTVDTHSHHWEASEAYRDSEKTFPSLDMTIRTKWDGAAVIWND
ncbi:inactive ubiquitin carboxyl-terminal hydrolase MINDY-4B [Scophthalmus maximus]|uniref:inactive ubiquitin carboxyl-terminal hydrolase MINDY-4B n=1 Tax=Scophthalmus maximus TaxID=52904 RepID=UPI001FA8BB84|nr:inactive ubiquitin carboxyl-terminal hydrolase MINDY-4B [Scophthalmus maximus]